MKRLIDVLAVGVTNDSGVAVDTGTVTFYLAGTSTLKTVYENWDLDEPYSNPATLDAAGRLIAYSDVKLKLVICDSNGNTVRTIDNVGTDDSDVNVSNQATFLSGMVMPYAGNSVPTGWLNCDGSAVSRSTYSDLFAAIGTVWGAGDSTTTFNVPDLRGRTLIGDGTGSGLTARTLGTEDIGEETHVLTDAELSSHTHAVSAAAHTHFTVANASANTNPVSSSTSITVNQPGLNVTDGGAARQLEGANSTPGLSLTNTALSGIATDVLGSDDAHNNMQPSAVVKWIIKT